MLNTWHLVQYQRYYTSWTAYVRRQAVQLDASGALLLSDEALRDRLCDVLAADGGGFAPKPRILVCAPSNAATDELLERLLREGFVDGDARGYRPDVLRVGFEEALSEPVRQART